jgi:hypothetical protein
VTIVSRRVSFRRVIALVETRMEMPPPQIVREPLARSELVKIASEQFGDMVKAVVDTE